MRRREFLAGAAALASGVLMPTKSSIGGADFEALDSFVMARMTRDHIPGLAAAIIESGNVIWSRAYGHADLASRTPMQSSTIQNIASISKTFTTMAVMQLRNLGLLDLDADVQDYVDFPVRNPEFPEAVITSRQLLTHTSSIDDGLAYGGLYRCDDPRISLSVWLEEYFTPAAEFYDPKRNFHDWEAGEKWTYCNTSYGLLGHLVSEISGIPFAEYCRRNIFLPLGMRDTSWFLADIDRSRHVTPYTWVEGGVARGPKWGGRPLGVIRESGPSLDQPLEDGFEPNCAYNHPNYPDGFLRTSVDDLSRYAIALLAGGVREGHRVLPASTLVEMMTPELVTPPGRKQGLTFYSTGNLNGETIWGHSGSDPGVNTNMSLLPDRGLGAIVFTNTNDINPQEITLELLKAAMKA